MDEKVKNFMDKVDMVTEKCNIVPEFLEYAVNYMKKPVITCIPALINKITSKFSLVTVCLLALVYAIYCLKNMVVSFFFKSGPSGISFGLALGAIIVTLLSCYIIYKTNGIFDKIIASSQCRISSLNFFSIMVLFFLFMTVILLVGGIYAAIAFKYFMFLVFGIGGAIFTFLMALFCAVPEDFSIAEDEKVSAGEDFIAIATFSVKVVLRLVPILIFIASIAGIVVLIPAIFRLYTQSSGDTVQLQGGLMLSEMFFYANFLLIGLFPLAAYLYYLITYVSLDLIRAVLSLPQKLDELKK